MTSIKIHTVKLALEFSIILILFISCEIDNSNSINMAEKNDIIPNIYNYGEKFFDLDNLKYIEKSKLSVYNKIKRENNYFNGFGQDNSFERAVFKSNKFILKSNSNIEVYDRNTNLITILNNNFEFGQLDNVTENMQIFASSTGVISCIRYAEKNGYIIKKYDKLGIVQNSWQIEHTKYTIYENQFIVNRIYLF